MDDFDIKRLKLIAKAARNAKIKLNNVLNDISRWNDSHKPAEAFRPPMKVLHQAVDALMDLNNACNERDRKHQQHEARKRIGQ